MPEHVLDTVVLQAMTFSDADGIEILLQGLGSSHARFPAEVYNRDEDSLPLPAADDELSEFARGLRYASRQIRLLPALDGERYAIWLRNAKLLGQHLDGGRLVIDPLTVEELLRREELMHEHGIGRGEAACITLVERYHATGVFLSSDEEACAVAQQLGIAFATVPDILAQWVWRCRPPQERLDALITGLRAARFGLKADVIEGLRQILLGQA
jgi:predicted nucleic acid-binding protein